MVGRRRNIAQVVTLIRLERHVAALIRPAVWSCGHGGGGSLLG